MKIYQHNKRLACMLEAIKPHFARLLSPIAYAACMLLPSYRGGDDTIADQHLTPAEQSQGFTAMLAVAAKMGFAIIEDRSRARPVSSSAFAFSAPRAEAAADAHIVAAVDTDKLAIIHREWLNFRSLRNCFSSVAAITAIGEAPLDWWKNYGSGSCLKPIAMALMSLPATEAANERGGSILNFLKDKRKAHMSSLNTDYRCAVYEWICSFHPQKAPYVEKLAEQRRKGRRFEHSPVSEGVLRVERKPYVLVDSIRVKPDEVGEKLLGARISKFAYAAEGEDEEASGYYEGEITGFKPIADSLLTVSERGLTPEARTELCRLRGSYKVTFADDTVEHLSMVDVLPRITFMPGDTVPMIHEYEDDFVRSGLESDDDGAVFDSGDSDYQD